MTKQDEKIYNCFKWYSRFKSEGSTDDEALEAVKCVLENGEDVEIQLLYMKTSSEIKHRQTLEYQNEQYLKIKEKAKEYRKMEQRLKATLKSLEQQPPTS